LVAVYKIAATRVGGKFSVETQYYACFGYTGLPRRPGFAYGRRKVLRLYG